jgi:hypothetical protein
VFVHAGLVEKAAVSFGAVLIGTSLAGIASRSKLTYKALVLLVLQSILLLLIDAMKQLVVITHDVCGYPRTTDSYNTSRIGCGVMLVQIPLTIAGLFLPKLFLPHLITEPLKRAVKNAWNTRQDDVIGRYCFLSAAVMLLLRSKTMPRDEQGHNGGPTAGFVLAAVCALFALTPSGLREHLFTAAAFLGGKLQRIAKMMCVR